MARPTGYRPKFHIPDLLARAEVGESLAEICAAWKIDTETFYAWEDRNKAFSVAVKRSLVLREKWWIQIGRAAMLDQATYKGKPIKVSLGYYVWLTKNILKWNDRQVIIENGRPNEYKPLPTLPQKPS